MKTTLFALVLFFTLDAHAQYDKWTFYLNGGIGLRIDYIEGEDGYSSDNIFAEGRLALGFFLLDRTLLGARLKSGITVQRPSDSEFWEETNYSLALFARQYFKPVSMFVFFGQLDVDYTRTAWDGAVEDFRGDRRIREFSIGVVPGVSYMVTDRLAIEATFGFVGMVMTHEREWSYEPGYDGPTSRSYPSVLMNTDLSTLKLGLTLML